MTVYKAIAIPPELPYLHSINLTQVEDYYYDSSLHSVVMKKDNTCVIVDYNLCVNNNDAVFDYSKYCEMRFKYTDTTSPFVEVAWNCDRMMWRTLRSSGMQNTMYSRENCVLVVFCSST